MSNNITARIQFKVLNILLKVFLGGMLFYGGIQKFQKPIPSPTSVIEQVKSGEEVAPNNEVLMIKNYIFGMKQTNYFWQFLGFMELLAGALILSQVFAVIGAFIALPMTTNIFLFHAFLETDEIGELAMTLGLLLINIWIIVAAYNKWKGIVSDKTALLFKTN